MRPPCSVWYSYAVIRVVPEPARGEFLNVGVVLFARTARFLEARIAVDRSRFRAFAHNLDLAAVERHLAAFTAVCEGGASGGPIGQFPPSERFHWLTAPRSTMIQTAPVHTGQCDDPTAALDILFVGFVPQSAVQ
jgi:hypothetical protein